MRKEIQRRDDVIQKEKSHVEHLEEVREKILVFVANNQKTIDQQVAKAVGIGATVAIFHLEELRKSKMVSDSYISGSAYSGSDGRREWSIAQAGRGYLVCYELIA